MDDGLLLNYLCANLYNLDYFFFCADIAMNGESASGSSISGIGIAK